MNASHLLARQYNARSEGGRFRSLCLYKVRQTKTAYPFYLHLKAEKDGLNLRSSPLNDTFGGARIEEIFSKCPAGHVPVIETHGVEYHPAPKNARSAGRYGSSYVTVIWGED